MNFFLLFLTIEKTGIVFLWKKIMYFLRFAVIIHLPFTGLQVLCHLGESRKPPLQMFIHSFNEHHISSIVMISWLAKSRVPAQKYWLQIIIKKITNIWWSTGLDWLKHRLALFCLVVHGGYCYRILLGHSYIFLFVVCPP